MIKLSEDDQLLKDFLNEHIDFYSLRKVGFFPKEMKKTDIHGQAERICKLFGYKTVYEYGAKVIHAHISYADGHRPSWVNEQGEYEQAPFVEKFGGIYE
ncbi:hypothetical protein MUK51_10820 [Sphingobacterium faecium]|uniref:hypothetical protein n=1 Tax=Sphingobacterium faecium TaxID=34087 RepID=UPI0021B656EA|nr:hypothetical protein [Sphingobacterium faecium]UXD67723.1 hypothetical protein MUK51_10820 [Sphingobacterium faecium]